jgi:ABC-type sulfate transport system permease component
MHIQIHHYSFHIANLYLNMIPHFLYFSFMYSNTISHFLLLFFILPIIYIYNRLNYEPSSILSIKHHLNTHNFYKSINFTFSFFFSHLTNMTHINYYISYKLLSKTYKPHHFHFNKIYT